MGWRRLRARGAGCWARLRPRRPWPSRCPGSAGLGPGNPPPSQAPGNDRSAPASTQENDPGGAQCGEQQDLFLKKAFILKALCPGGRQRGAVFRKGLKKDQVLIKTKHRETKPRPGGPSEQTDSADTRRSGAAPARRPRRLAACGSQPARAGQWGTKGGSEK